MTEQLRVTAYVKRLLYLGKQICHHTLEDLSICLRISNKLYRINRWVNYFLIRLSTMGVLFSSCLFSERNASFARWGRRFNNIILAMRNFVFMKITILTFQSFNKREEKIKWTYIFPYRYDLCKEKVFFNNTDVWCFDLFHRREKNIMTNVFPYRYGWLLLKPGPGLWTRTLGPGPGPRSWTRTLKNLDSEKPGPWKTWNKYRIKKYVWL